MSDLDIDNICRLCCEKKGRLRALFEPKPPNDSLSLQQIILDVTRLEVEPGDGMPQRICRTCSTTLIKMHETIEGYRTNDSRLRKQLLGGTVLPDVEIKEEEVDIELLEAACKQDMMIEDISIKQEADEEYLDYEKLDESTEPEAADEDNPTAKEDDSETDVADEALEHDDEWIPEEEIGEKDPKTKKLKGRKRIPKPKAGKRKYTRRNPNDPPKPGRKRFQDFKCYVCMEDSHETAEAMLAHLNTSHSDMLPYTCSECVTETVVIKTVGILNNHKRQHLNPEKCPFCDKRYTNKSGVDLHVEKHHKGGTDPNPSPCEHCGKVCPNKIALKYHMRIHTAASTCELCGKVFKERSKLKRHIQNRHEKLKKYECHICKKKLSSMSAVQFHIDTYHSSQVFTCSYCPKSFSSKLTHRAHEKKHVENQNYVATKDWKEYYTVLDGLEGNGEKLKKCNLCGVVARNMGPHMHKVHFPTEYRCEICGMSYKQKQSYTVHVQEHEHGKAHRCPICGREFSEKRQLISHLRTKKHEDHPLAQEMLGTIRTANSTNAESSNSRMDDEETQEEIHIGFDDGMHNLM